MPNNVAAMMPSNGALMLLDANKKFTAKSSAKGQTPSNRNADYNEYRTAAVWHCVATG
jgi:hypothetical protein